MMKNIYIPIIMSSMITNMSIATDIIIHKQKRS